MSNIPLPQGASKLSEIFVDNAELLANTPVGNDAMSFSESLQSVIGDLGNRIGFIFTSQNPYPSPSSAGTISWASGIITFVSGTSMVLKILQAASGVAVDLVLQYGGTNGETTFNAVALSSGQILYIELDRGNLSSSPLTLHNAASGGSIVTGKTVKIATSLPAFVNTNATGMGPQGTIAIPLAINIAGTIYWIPHGIAWPSGTASPLGAVLTTTSTQVGMVFDYAPFYTAGGTSASGKPLPLGYNSLLAAFSGFAPCNGAIITDTASGLANPTRNLDGTPNGTTNFNDDVFTPCLNGPFFPWTNVSQAYFVGDYVEYSGENFVAWLAQASGSSPTPVAALTINSPFFVWASGNTYNQYQIVFNTADSNYYYSLINSNIGHQPDLSPADWTLVYWVPEAIYNALNLDNPFNKYRRTTVNSGIQTFTLGYSVPGPAGSPSSYGGASTVSLGGANAPAHYHNSSNMAADFTALGNDFVWRETSGNGNPAWSATLAWVNGGPAVGASNAVAAGIGMPVFGATTAPIYTGSGTAFSIYPPFFQTVKVVRIY